MNVIARARFDTGGPWWVYLIPAATVLALFGYIAWCIWTDPLRRLQAEEKGGGNDDQR